MFSFVTPAYNAAAYLPHTLDSVLSQTYPDWEMILMVDEGSTDYTLDVAKRYAERDSRIRVFTAPHCTACEKLNIALEKASFNWICGLDADDMAYPERLAVIKAAIEARPEVIAWSGYADYFNERGEIVFLSQLGPTTDEAFHAARARGEPLMMSHSAMTYRRDIALQLGGYNPVICNAADIDLCDRMSDVGLMLTLPQTLARYRIHSGSMSMKKFEQQAYNLRYVWRRRQAQVRGETLTWDEYQLRQATLPPTKHFQEWAIDHSRLFWREAGIALGERRYTKVATSLFLSTALNPSFVINKVAGQVSRRISRRR